MNSKLDVTVAVDVGSGGQTPASKDPAHPSPAAGGGMTAYPHDVQQSLPSSIFVTFRRWPLVPSAELYRLQGALTQCLELAGPDSDHKLLTLVTDELERRTAETPHLPHHDVRGIRAAHAGTHRRRPGRL